MDVLTFSDLQARFGEVLDHVVKTGVPVLVTRESGEAVVLVSMAEAKLGDPTDHLLASRANAQRLAAAVAQLDAIEKDKRLA